jgi:hypothetical protein
MAAAVPLPSEEKIRILTADPKLTPEQANLYGDLFADAGRWAQAMMFYERSRDPGRLARVKKEAVRAGDAFLLHGITRLIPDLVDELEWREAGERALAEGKLVFARDCFEKSGDADKAEAAREEWLKIFPPPPTASNRPAGS